MSDCFELGSKKVRFCTEPKKLNKLKPSRKSKSLTKKRRRSKRRIRRPKSRRKSYGCSDDSESDPCESESDDNCCESSVDELSDFEFEIVNKPEPVKIEKTQNSKKSVDQQYFEIPFDKKLPLVYKGIEFKK